MRGTAYGVGVGPGDPGLLTLRAASVIRACGVIALPGKNPRDTAAYKIAVQAVPELRDKALLPLEMPMVRDRAAMETAHRGAAGRIEAWLDRGEDVACLTLGDPSVYSTFGYLRRHLEADGYAVEIVPGVPSFCAAAARLHVPLTRWDEPLHILPAAHGGALPEGRGAWVLMKPAGRLRAVREAVKRSGRRAWMVENCGMPGERVWDGAENLPDEAGYFSIIIAREANG